MELEQRTVRKLTLRIVPFLVLCYIAAYLDRVNIGFAAPSMSKDLGFTATAYAFGAGVFFLTYFLFEVPSNLLLERYGARKWIARIMFTWGLLSGGMAFVHGQRSFYFLRMLLGLAEAGFFPGIIFYLSLWFPSVYRARIMGLFLIAIPLSSVIGAPVSGVVLNLSGVLGLHGWQWLFLLEALPAVVLSVCVLFLLTDRPEQAGWLTGEERDWLVTRLDEERTAATPKKRAKLISVMFQPQVLLLCLVYFGATACLYGLSFYLPTIVKGFRLSEVKSGCVIAIPYIAGLLGMLAWSRSSDHHQERRNHSSIALLFAAVGIASSVLFIGPAGKMAAFSLAGVGVFACLPLLWTLPTTTLHGPAAAGAIALINSVGNLSGFVGTYAIGWLKDRTGNYSAGLLAVAATGFLGAVIIARMPAKVGVIARSES